MVTLDRVRVSVERARYNNSNIRDSDASKIMVNAYSPYHKNSKATSKKLADQLLRLEIASFRLGERTRAWSDLPPVVRATGMSRMVRVSGEVVMLSDCQHCRTGIYFPDPSTHNPKRVWKHVVTNARPCQLAELRNADPASTFTSRGLWHATPEVYVIDEQVLT